MASIYDYDDYKNYLNTILDDPQRGGRGARARLSRAIGVQTAYTAQVLRGPAHFSLEQAELINDFLIHNDEEGQFFLLLVQRQRAGLPKLEKRFTRQINAIRESRLVLKNRLGISENLNEHDQINYYSAWYYAALHVAVSIPRFRSVSAAAEALQLDPRVVSEALDFLVRVGLVVRTDDPNAPFHVGQTRIHLGSDSPLISKHHINWRLQCIRALEGRERENLHYSSVVSISEDDAVRIREILVREIQNIKSIIRESPEERMQCFCLDFFKV